MGTLLHVLQHALGRDEFGRRPRNRTDDYRNHYVASEGHHSWDALREAVTKGLMVEHAPREISGGAPIFTVTDAGKAYIAEHSPKPPRVSRSKARYQRFLDADSGYTFSAWLKRGDEPTFRMAKVAGKRVKIVPHEGVDGFICKWTDYCANCIPDLENVSPPSRGSGCRECGYTGRSRRVEWVPLSVGADDVSETTNAKKAPSIQPAKQTEPRERR